MWNVNESQRQGSSIFIFIASNVLIEFRRTCSWQSHDCHACPRPKGFRNVLSVPDTLQGYMKSITLPKRGWGLSMTQCHKWELVGHISVSHLCSFAYSPIRWVRNVMSHHYSLLYNPHHWWFPVLPLCLTYLTSAGKMEIMLAALTQTPPFEPNTSVHGLTCMYDPTPLTCMAHHLNFKAKQWCWHIQPNASM